MNMSYIIIYYVGICSKVKNMICLVWIQNIYVEVVEYDISHPTIRLWLSLVETTGVWTSELIKVEKRESSLYSCVILTDFIASPTRIQEINS